MAEKEEKSRTSFADILKISKKGLSGRILTDNCKAKKGPVEYTRFLIL